jgi:hypothetical protein
MVTIRAFNKAGIEYFRRSLENIISEKTNDLPDDLVFNDSLTLSADWIEIELRDFFNKFQMAEYLHERIQQISLEDKYYDPGLWSWLSAFYFDVVCPLEDGQRSVKQFERYIPDEKRDWRTYYRHLIAFPVRIYGDHGDTSRILLFNPPHILGDFVEQLASRQDIAMNRGVLEAANLLYWDNERETSIPGATSRNKPGNIRRFVSLLQQFDLTFDLQSMSGQQIVNLLPYNEFSDWQIKA